MKLKLGVAVKVDKPSRVGFGIVILFIGAAIFVKMLAIINSLDNINSFAQENTQGGKLIWELTGHLWSTFILTCLLIALIVIQYQSSISQKRLLPVLLLMAIAAPATMIYFDNDIKDGAKVTIQKQGMELCAEGVIGRGKFSQAYLEFKPHCKPQ